MFNEPKNIIIAVLVVISLGFAYLYFGAGTGGAVSGAEVANNAIAYINTSILQGSAEASLVGDATEENGLYKFAISLNGNEFFSYATKDGQLFFPEGIALVEDPLEADAPTETETPVVDLEINENDHIRGNENANITIMEYSDYQCSFCFRFHNTMREVMENFADDVRWVYRHFPLDSIHPSARKAAEAAECAGDQDKFWEYTDMLYDNQISIKPAYFTELAEELSLDTATFDECVDSGKYADKVEADYQSGITAGVRGTPGGFINGETIGGAVPFATLEQMINDILAQNAEAPAEEGSEE